MNKAIKTLLLTIFAILFSLPLSFAINVKCSYNIPETISAGSTYTIVCTLENNETVERSFYVLFQINETSGNYPIWRNDFNVNASVNVFSLNCSEIDNGTFYCFNGTDEYYLKPGKASLNLNFTSNPALFPSNYSFSLSIVTSKIFASNENIIITQSTTLTSAGLTIYSTLFNPTSSDQETKITVPIPNSNTMVNLTLTLPPNSYKEIVSLQNGLIVIAPNETKINDISFSNSTVITGNTQVINQTLTLNISGPHATTKEIWLYVNGNGEPSQIIAQLSTGQLIITPNNWVYNDTTKILKFNVTFSSPILVNIFWISFITLPPAPAAAVGAGVGVPVPPTLGVKIINPTISIAQAANSSVTYTVTIQNTGTTTGNFSLFIIGLPSNYFLVSPPITLKSLETGRLTYTLNLPADAKNATFKVVVNGSANGLTASSSYDVTLTVLPQTVINITTPVPVNVTQNVTVSVPVNVTGVPAIITGAAVAISNLASSRTFQIASISAISFVALIFVIRFVANRRKPWRTSFKLSYRERTITSLKEQIKKVLKEEE